MPYYVVLQYREKTDKTAATFEFSGVFDDRDKAIAACRDWSYCVNGPIEMNQSQPHETTHDMAECFYPIVRPEVPFDWCFYTGVERKTARFSSAVLGLGLRIARCLDRRLRWGGFRG
jgi:hypothetical protein